MARPSPTSRKESSLDGPFATTTKRNALCRKPVPTKYYVFYGEGSEISQRNGPSMNAEERGEVRMNDEELRYLTEIADRELRALDRRMARLRELRFEFIFTDAEKTAWYQTEPDFPKRIMNPLTAHKLTTR